MDPLGALPSITDLTDLIPWKDTEIPQYDLTTEASSAAKRETPFPQYNYLNEKIMLWSGDLTQLNTEAIVNSTNEALNDRTILSERIFNKAGPDLRAEIKANIKGCKTGEAKVTKGYKLPARFIIHTVGPRYNLKYKTAAESALYNCYRNVLQSSREKGIRTLGLCCIHSMRRSYPAYEGAHIAIRTVRRFLEKYGSEFDTVVFVTTGEDVEVYNSLLPLYFPRSKQEEFFAAQHLPYDVGNETGEPIIAERQIRIVDKPMFLTKPKGTEDFEETVDISAQFETSVAVGRHDFAKMQSDHDRARRMKLNKHRGHSEDIHDLVSHQRRYDRWLQRARQEDLREVAALRCLYQSGFDKHGRPVIVFIGKNFPATTTNLEKALMFLILNMDSIVNQPYVIVYLHTLTIKDNQPNISFIKEIYNIVDAKYRKNLKAFYIVHPTFWSKVFTWFFTTFSLADMKSKVYNLPGLEYIYSRINPDQLDLPRFVVDYDIQINGTRYYDPREDEAIGSL